jgi:hypothetical protein
VSFESLEIAVPQAQGDYTLEFDLVRGVGQWFSRDVVPAPVQPSEPARVKARLKPPPLEWGASFTSHNTPAHLLAGQTVDVALRIANVGRRTWPAQGEHRVLAGYRWLTVDGAPSADVPELRTALPHDILPGEREEFAASLVTPDRAGLYRLTWDLFAERIAWFADGGNPVLDIPVRVTDASVVGTGWRAEASSNGTQALLAIDGDLGSFWTSSEPQATGMWFRVDLGEPALIDGLAFRSPGAGHPYAFTVRVSEEGETWRTVAAVQDNSSDVVTDFAPAHVRYAQVDLILPSAEEWMIAAVEIHSGAAWKATASHKNEFAGHAIDDNPLTAWSTVEPQAANMWFQIDLGRVESVTGVTLLPPVNEYPAGYRLALWKENAGGWQKVAERLDNRGPVDVRFAPIETQFVNLQLLQAAEIPFAVRSSRIVRAMTGWTGPVRTP